MASLLQVRDAIALNGIAEASQLSLQLTIPLRLVEAILEQLMMMGKIERIKQNTLCLTGSCKSCPESSKCDQVIYRLRAYSTSSLAIAVHLDDQAEMLNPTRRHSD